MQSDKLPQVTSLESASVGAGDVMFGNEVNWGFGVEEKVGLPNL